MSAAFTPAELETLLHRPVRRLVTARDRAAYRGRRVVVTGAGGTVGSELARQIAACAPAQLVLVDHSELHLFEIERELADAGHQSAIAPALLDVSRPGAMDRLCRRVRPDVVFHAAAYKHVTMLERDVCAAVTANVQGTAETMEAARDCHARFVLVSSDKAAAPRSIMGATKRVAELVTLAGATERFRPIVVRFGNVLGSSGSLLVLLRDRIRRRLSITLTDPRATRYVMTAGEAVSLVMKADVLSDRPEIYWLDMGEPIAIGALAERLMTLEARAGHARVPVEVIGLRPGEKLREELTVQGLRLCRTRHRRIWVARQAAGRDVAVAGAAARLRAAAEDGDARAALEALVGAVPEFEPSREAWAESRRLGTGAGRRTSLRRTA